MTAHQPSPLHARRATVATTLAVVGMMVVGSAVARSSTRAVGALPACRYADLLTSPRGYGDWQITLVDTILSVTQSYVPPDLVSVSEAGLAGNGRVRSIVVDDLRAMHEAAAAAGAGIGIESAYRSYADQKQLFDAWVKQYGYSRALMSRHGRATPDTSSASRSTSGATRRRRARSAPRCRPQVDSRPRVGIRLRPELPEGPDQPDLLRR